MRRNRGGLTLIEGLLAAALLASCVVAVLQTFRTGVKQTERVEGEALAAALAQDAIDGIAAVPYPHLVRAAREMGVKNDPERALAIARFAGLLADPGLYAVRRRLSALGSASHDVFATIELFDGGAGAGRLLELTVQVRWTDALAPGKPVTRSVVLRRLLTDDEEVDA